MTSLIRTTFCTPRSCRCGSPFRGARARLHMAIAALDDMLNWLNKSGRVAIYDATNSTKERRQV